MKINDFKELQKARFDEAVIQILIELDELSDSGHRSAIYQALSHALVSYIGSKPNIPMVTDIGDSEYPETDSTYFWLNCLLDSLFKLFDNIFTLDCLKEYKIGENHSLGGFLTDEAEKIRASINEYDLRSK